MPEKATNMEQKTLKQVMEYENVLPEGFDGIFRFTNDTDEDFVGEWGGKEYVFPARTTSPMIMPQFTQLEIQQIRKKFAKDLATREFYRSKNYAKLTMQERNPDGTPRLNGIHQAATYSEERELVSFIQSCLKPLAVGHAKVQDAPRVDITQKLSRDDDGELNTVPVRTEADLAAISDKKTGGLRRKAGLE